VLSFEEIILNHLLKEKIAAQLAKMSLKEQKEFLRKIRSGEIKLTD